MSQSTAPPPAPVTKKGVREPFASNPEQTEDRALRIAIEARDRISGVEKRLGRPPDPAVHGDDGEGVEGRLAVVERVVGDPPDPIAKKPATGAIGSILSLETSLNALTLELRADRVAREGLRSFLTRLAWGLGLPLSVAGVAGIASVIWRWVSTLHH